MDNFKYQLYFLSFYNSQKLREVTKQYPFTDIFVQLNFSNFIFEKLSKLIFKRKNRIRFNGKVDFCEEYFFRSFTVREMRGEFESAFCPNYPRQSKNYHCLSLHLFADEQTRGMRQVVARNSDVPNFCSIIQLRCGEAIACRKWKLFQNNVFSLKR